MLYEREAIAAGASGRNSGVVQHPLDPELVDLYEESRRALPHARPRLRAARGPGRAAARLRRSRARSRPTFPELRPTRLEGAELRALEPRSPTGLSAWRLETGRPVPPAAAANAFAPRAHEAGASCRSAQAALAHVENGRATGVTIDGVPPPGRRGRPRRRALDAGRLSISPLWGVVVELELPDAPRHVLEEAGIDALTQRRGARRACSSARSPRAGSRRVGSSFTPERAGSGGAGAGDRGERHRASSRPGGRAGREACGRARGRARRTAGRCSARSRAWRAWRSRAATARGGSRWGRLRPGSWPISCWGGGRTFRRRWLQRGSS